MSDVFDVDAQAGAYKPVRIKLRGEEYPLADSAYAVLALSDFAGSLVSDGGDLKHTEVARHIKKLFDLVAPEEAPRDLNMAEELALVGPITEVLQRFSRITFRP